MEMTCPTCGAVFDCAGHHAPHPCFGCVYAGVMREGAERFAPLSDPLSRLLEVELSVDQTGGMILCLAVPLPRGFYAWFSEFERVGEDDPEGLAGFGVYYWGGDDGDDDGGGSRWVAADLPYDADHGREIAEWAAPLLSQVAAEATAGATIQSLTVGEYHAH